MDRSATVIIVDDEQEAIDYLSILINESFPKLEIIATSNTSESAIQQISRLEPDLVFLDIKIDNKNGFEILKDLGKINYSPHIIFVTAFDHYAIDAFKVNAIDYLLKPVEIEQLQRAVNKYLDLNEKKTYFENIQNLISGSKRKIRFNSRTGFILIDTRDIVYCQSDGNYSEIYLKDGSKKIVSYNLRSLMKELPDDSFTRISRFNVINEKYLEEVDKRKRICILNNGFSNVSLSYSPRIYNI